MATVMLPKVDGNDSNHSRLVRRVKLLLDDGRASQLADLGLKRSAFIVAAVNRASELDESRAEVALPLAEADLVFDRPERFVHGLELRRELVKLRASLECARTCGLEQLELLTYMLEPRGIGD